MPYSTYHCPTNSQANSFWPAPAGGTGKPGFKPQTFNSIIDSIYIWLESHNASGYNLSNLGNLYINDGGKAGIFNGKHLTFTSAGVGVGVDLPGAELDVSGGTLGATLPAAKIVMRLIAQTNEQDEYRWDLIRDTAGSTWTGSRWFNRRVVDGNTVAGISYGYFDIQFHTDTNAGVRMKIRQDGVLYLFNAPTYASNALAKAALGAGAVWSKNDGSGNFGLFVAA